MATRRRPKRKRSSHRTTLPVLRILLTMVVVVVLLFLGYVWWSAGEKLSARRVHEIVTLAFSDAGIPATKVVTRTRADGTVSFQARCDTDEVQRFEQALQPLLVDSDAALKIEDKGSDRWIRLTTGSDRYTILLLGGASASGKPAAPAHPRRAAPKAPAHPRSYPWKHEGQPQVAIILDDVGMGHMASFRGALEIPYPITFSILPFRRFSRECASMARGHGFEIMLHMPMEPTGYPKEDPGPGAIMEQDSRRKVEEKIQAALKNVIYARGINNHMGSKITALPFTMRVTLQCLKREGLFFVDSRTTPNTVAIREAEALGVPAISRDVFLDNSRKPEDIRRMLHIAVEKARQRGYVVAIGHNYPETVTVLHQAMPRLDKDVNFVFVQELIHELGR